MSEEEFIEIENIIDAGLELAQKRMIEEKAIRDESIVVYDPDVGTTVRIKARDLTDRAEPSKSQ